MPSRPTLTNAQSTSPRQSSHTVNDVVHAISRKLTTQNIENINPPPAVPSQPSSFAVRRSSFKMDHLLHPQRKEKKRDNSPERDSNRKEKRASMSLRSSHKSKDRTAASSPRLAPIRAAKFEMIMESGPAVLQGAVSNSTGALMSGRLKLLVEDPTGQVTIEKFTMILQATTTTKKPISKECGKCIEKVEEMKKWNFLSEPKTFYKERDNQFPWSYLVAGNMPATTHAQLGSIDYAFVVLATTTTGDDISFRHPLVVQRAVKPTPDKSSIRIFPPTHLTGRVILAPVVHPIGAIPVQMTLSGVVERKAESQTRWRLRKMMWRVEEHCKVISAPCEKHKGKVSEGKAIQHSEFRTLGNDELKSGWKTDFDTAGGEISLEFEASVATKASHKVTCDVESASGLEVKHNLVIELIVAEEFCPNRNTSLITPTGAARVLRMQFAIIVTERAGMGISWDEEMPPMYEDVPDSPPGYGSADKNDGAWGGAIMEDYNGPELEYQELERMHSENPNDPPIYRERDNPVSNEGLPMRTHRRTDTSEYETEAVRATRNRLAGFRLDELETEPPQYALRGRGESTPDEETIEEDYGEGESGAAAVDRRGH